jgi:pimeloyl-ACP methyl ester carboxylesterase
VSSILQPGTGAPAFAQRLRQRERLLGALVDGGQISLDLTRGLDFVVVAGVARYGSARALLGAQTPLLVMVESADEVAPARAAGADGVVTTEVAQDAVNDVDAVLSDGGRARFVTSPQAARAAFASGADLVVYDLPAMLAAAVSGLAEGRPPEPPLTDREPLVLLSGMLCDASLWEGLAARLSDVVLPWPCRIDLDDSVTEMAASVLAEAPPRFALGGHSLGAIVALEVIRQAPARVTGLLLVNASARGPAQAQQDAWAQWRHRATAGELEQIAQELATASLGPAAREDAAAVHATVAMAMAVGVDGFLRQLSAQSTRPDSLASLSEITVPVLVVSGELDGICPPALQRELADHCEGSRLVSIQGGGHLLPLESPDSLADEVRGWLEGRHGPTSVPASVPAAL